MRGAFAVVAAIVAIVVGSGCHDEARVMLTLHGQVADAQRVEVILASPELELRAQRSGGVKELVYYTAQRALVDGYELKSTDVVDGFKLQLQHDRRTSFLPVVIVRDGTGTIVGAGVYQPTELFDDDEHTVGIEHDGSAVRVFDIDIEPVMLDEGLAGTGPMRPSSMRSVACNGAPSGLVWKRGDGGQLRILYPESGDDAHERLASPDLDCDLHTAGMFGAERGLEDDRLDCDDLDGHVSPQAAEVCNGLDDNCNDRDSGFALSPTCPSCGVVGEGVCDDAYLPNSLGEHCMTLAGGLSCAACELDFEGATAATVSVCGGTFAYPVPRCDLGCDATVISVAAGWDVLIGDESTDLVPVGQTVRFGGTPAAEPHLWISPSTGISSFPTPGTIGWFTIRFAPVAPGLLPQATTFKLGLSAQSSSCDPTVQHVRCM